MNSPVSEIINNLIQIKRIDYDRKYSRLAKLHKYWARKPWFVIEQYITRYSQERELVLDPFCGSGLIGLEAILQNRDFMGYDLNPFAAFLTENTLSVDFDTQEFDREFKLIEKDLKKQIMSLYACGEYYLLYSIVGNKNRKDYNAVVCDFNLRNRKKVLLDKDTCRPEIVFPQGLYYPDKPFPKKFYKDRFSYKGVSNVSDMFSKRNLLALTFLFDRIRHSEFKHKNLFILAFTNTLLHVSKLKAENVRPLSVNNFWIPDDYIEENVWWRFSDRVNNVHLAKTSQVQRFKESNYNSLGTYRTFNKSALHMDEIGDETIDYVITDPPYGDAIQYSELSYVWNCWLEKDFDIRDEVVINPVQGKGIKEYSSQMKQSIEEISRVLKQDGYFTLCFHNKDSRIWIKLVEILKEAELNLVDISSYDTFGFPYNKSWANFSPKSDLYITLKRKSVPLRRLKSKTLDPEKIAEEICSYLVSRNGSDFDLNKAYDLFVAVMIAEIMNGNKIADSNKLNIRSIVHMFERAVKYENIQGRIF